MSASRGISHQLNTLVTATILLVAFAVAAVAVGTQYHLAVVEHQQDRARIEQNVVPVVSYLLWVVNREQTLQLGRSLAENPGIVGVSITDESGDALFAALPDSTPNRIGPIVASWPLLHVREADVIEIGRLEIAFRNPWRSAFTPAFVLLLFADLLVLLFPLLFLISRFRSIVYMPLHNLARDIGALEFPHELPQWWFTALHQDRITETSKIRTLLSDMAGQIRDEIDERQRTELALAATVEQKTVLLQEVHHRVKNNLQLIVSLMSLQRENLVDESARQALIDSENRVLSMALVHEMVYQEQLFSAIRLDQYLTELTNATVLPPASEQSRVEIQRDFVEVEVSLDTAIPLGLITSELVTNAVKHAFVGLESGTITMRTARNQENSHLTITVKDNGRGLPRDWMSHRTTSMGFTIIEALCAQLGSTLEVVPCDEGACFSLSVPLRSTLPETDTP